MCLRGAVWHNARHLTPGRALELGFKCTTRTWQDGPCHTPQKQVQAERKEDIVTTPKQIKLTKEGYERLEQALAQEQERLIEALSLIHI